MAKDNNALVITIAQSKGKADAGTKGAKRAWSGTVDYDLARIHKANPELLEVFLHNGIKQWLKNSAASIDKEAEGIAAMQARLEKLYAGDMDRKYHYASPIERRATDNLIAALREAAKVAQIVVTDDQLRTTAAAELKGATGAQWLAEAKGQLEAEQQRASAGASSMLKALAAFAPPAVEAQAPAQPSKT